MSQDNGVSVSTINFSPLIRLSKSFGIDAKVEPPFLDDTVVIFTKKIFDGSTQCYKYAFNLYELEGLEACHLREVFKYVFFDKILHYFIQAEASAFSKGDIYD